MNRKVNVFALHMDFKSLMRLDFWKYTFAGASHAWKFVNILSYLNVD